ncbi:hypothetical protein QBC33DRAFT_595016 [Phialemonium atrogriseum]|uniref:Uncharacterized protein n=1 Tax=Phialemonium atrogriseum TaxID=1093897 RepID=A0AAJ0BUU4_9PEZI|nr:uncharacterized protein QBC33DRAFT_595016 [Phialemonium atrogriseum]KAK1764402.1 hypothetical protein QBC33DRAFT_595016 [Phialemonium atrogriseum]
MLILRGLSALFVGLTVVTQASPSESLRLSRSLPLESHLLRTNAEELLESAGRENEGHSSLSAQFVRLLPRGSLHRRRQDPSQRRVLSRDEEYASSTPAAYSGKNGTRLACEGCPDDGTTCSEGGCTSLRNPEAVATAVIVTTTSTHTVTSFTGGQTFVEISTVFETLTMVDPSEETQTSTISITSFFNRRGIRTARSEGSSFPNATIALGRRQDPAPTGTTVTVDTTTTIYISGDTTVTIPQTVFVTTTVAPNAVTTIYTTTTIYTGRPEGTTTADTNPTTINTSQPLPSTLSTSTSEPSSGSASVEPTESTTPISTSQSSRPQSSSLSTSSSGSTSITSATSETMTSTTFGSSTAAQPTSTEAPLPGPMTQEPPPNLSLNSDQIAGIALGAIFLLFLLVAFGFLLRWIVRRRRSRQAVMRQQLSQPTSATSARTGDLLATGGSSRSGGGGGRTDAASGGGASGLTGQGEVRIVIRPAPPKARRTQSSGLWPMPPGHGGQTYSFFVEETTTGETTPQDPGEWSIASERGSSNGQGRGGSGAPSPSGAAGDNGSPSHISVGWGTSIGASSQYPSGVTTVNANLAPPPATHGNRRWRRSSSSRRGTGGSGIGNAF